MANGSVRIVDSQSNFAGGADSSKVPMRASRDDPSGLLPSQSSWLQNATARGGGLSPRSGWVRIRSLPGALFQEAYMYRAMDGYPYIVYQANGRIYTIRVDSDNSVVDLSAISGLTNNPTTPKAFQAQGEEFLVLQSGDYETLPLFYDGNTLWRSRGPVSSAIPNASFTVPAIGQPVLVTLSGPYFPNGLVNQTFTIDGYQYQQVEPGQRYNATPNGYSTLCPLVGKSASFPATFNFPKIGGGVSAVSLRGLEVTFNAGSNPSTGPAVTTFFTDVALTTGSFIYTTFDYDFGGGCVASEIRLSLAANPLAGPGANQVWLININDPRAGTAISVPSMPAQLPAGGPMDYYMGRFWVANGREYIGSDIVGGPNGTGAYDFRDSILAVEENAYLVGGGSFAVPTNAGNITALFHNNALDTATGEGVLHVGTSKSIFSVNVVPTRAEWIALEEPIQRVEQLNFGPVSDRSVAAQNGDVFYRALDGIRSLITAIRYFGQWGNRPISTEVERALDSDDPTLLQCASSISFNNRLYTTCLPVATTLGIAYQGIVALDFEPISGLGLNTIPSWDGMLEGLDVLKLLEGEFGGEQRAFALVHSRLTHELELWEITKDDKSDENTFGESRITWAVETRSFAFGDPNLLKELETMRMWVDKLYGRVDFTLYYRNDQNACWNFWNAWTQCAARNDCENPGNTPCPYPTQIYKEQYRAMMLMPKPALVCDSQSDRPTTQAYSFQLRLVIKGWCRIRGLFLYALPKMETAFQDMYCLGDDPCASCPPGAEGPAGLQGNPGTGVQSFRGGALDPNGVQDGNRGDLYKSDTGLGGDGSIWVKRTNGGSTGWI